MPAVTASVAFVASRLWNEQIKAFTPFGMQVQRFRLTIQTWGEMLMLYWS